MQSHVGTPLFASPEIVRHEMYDQSTDVYSFGVTILAMAIENDYCTFVQDEFKELMGRQATSWDDVVKGLSIANGEEGSFRPRTPAHAPPLINDLIITCFDQDPKERPQFEDIIRFLVSGVAKQVERQIYPRAPSRSNDNWNKRLTGVNDACSKIAANAGHEMPDRAADANVSADASGPEQNESWQDRVAARKAEREREEHGGGGGGGGASNSHPSTQSSATGNMRSSETAHAPASGNNGNFRANSAGWQAQSISFSGSAVNIQGESEETANIVNNDGTGSSAVPRQWVAEGEARSFIPSNAGAGAEGMGALTTSMSNVSNLDADRLTAKLGYGGISAAQNPIASTDRDQTDLRTQGTVALQSWHLLLRCSGPQKRGCRRAEERISGQGLRARAMPPATHLARPTTSGASRFHRPRRTTLWAVLVGPNLT